MSSPDREQVVYVYDLPYIDREKFCTILNQSNKWEELATTMGFSNNEVQALRRERNPCDELLTLWSHHNHTIIELFALLSGTHLYQAMVTLKPFVDKKYHRLLHQGEGNLQQVFGGSGTNRSLAIGHQNFNVDQSQKVNKKYFQESTKILNNSAAAGKKELSSVSNNIVASMAALQIFSTSLPRISYLDLRVSTGNWNKRSLLGRGGFGTVFKGLWKNTEVAVKRIERRGPYSDESYAQQLEQSFREIKILNSTPHENILSLYAYSTDGDVPCLVYQYMPNGSLEDRLKMKGNTPSLTWKQRFEIAKGTARGLQYLHTIGNKPLIHGDIKSANILLDKNYEPKIGDFGLAKEGSVDDSMEVSKIQGTRPYLPSEYILERKLSTKIDSYSFGIVMYELATGQPAFYKHRTEKKLLKDYLENFVCMNLDMVRDNLAGKEDSEIFEYLFELGNWCSKRSADERPTMELAYKHIISYENEALSKKVKQVKL